MLQGIARDDIVPGLCLPSAVIAFRTLESCPNKSNPSSVTDRLSSIIFLAIRMFHISSSVFISVEVYLLRLNMGRFKSFALKNGVDIFPLSPTAFRIFLNLYLWNLSRMSF